MMLIETPKQVDADPPIDDIDRFDVLQTLEIGDRWFRLYTPWLDTYVCTFVDATRIVIHRVQHRNVSSENA